MDSHGSYCELSNLDQQHIFIKGIFRRFVPFEEVAVGLIIIQIDSSELYVDRAYFERDQINGQMVLTFTTTFPP